MRDLFLSADYLTHRTVRRHPALRWAGLLTLGFLLAQAPFLVLAVRILSRGQQLSFRAAQLDEARRVWLRQAEELRPLRARYEQARRWQRWTASRRPASAVLARIEEGFGALPLALHGLEFHVAARPGDPSTNGYPLPVEVTLNLRGWWREPEAGRAVTRELFAPLIPAELPPGPAEGAPVNGDAASTGAGLEPFHLRWSFRPDQLSLPRLGLRPALAAAGPALDTPDLLANPPARPEEAAHP